MNQVGVFALLQISGLYFIGANGLSAADLRFLRYRPTRNRPVQVSIPATRPGMSPENFRDESQGWCRTMPIRQRLESEGCDSKTIMNRFCAGQCSSYYVPRALPIGDSSGSGGHCKTCKASKVKWRTVTLKCRNSSERRKTKLVEIVQACACEACNGVPGFVLTLGRQGRQSVPGNVTTNRSSRRSSSVATPPAGTVKPKRKKKRRRKGKRRNRKRARGSQAPLATRSVTTPAPDLTTTTRA